MFSWSQASQTADFRRPGVSNRPAGTVTKSAMPTAFDWLLCIVATIRKNGRLVTAT
jgi:hypothetical protein